MLWAERKIVNLELFTVKENFAAPNAGSDYNICSWNVELGDIAMQTSYSWRPNEP